MAWLGVVDETIGRCRPLTATRGSIVQHAYCFAMDRLLPRPLAQASDYYFLRRRHVPDRRKRRR